MYMCMVIKLTSFVIKKNVWPIQSLPMSPYTSLYAYINSLRPSDAIDLGQHWLR